MFAADPIFADRRLAEIYDALDGERDDLDLYLELIAARSATSVLDVGCGTGTLATALALAGYDVIGVDPAVASLDVARRKFGADRVRWHHGTVESLDDVMVDVATMTANVAQVFLDDGEWLATLRSIRRRLRPGGVLIFETRDPAAAAWTQWNQSASFTRTDVSGVGTVESWVDLLYVALPLVAFRWTFHFVDTDDLVISDSTLRFRERIEIEAALEQCGFDVVEVLDAPDRPGNEFVFVARAIRRRDHLRSSVSVTRASHPDAYAEAMDPTEMHERSQAVFGEVLGRVTDSDLGRSTPCSAWTVADLIDHVVDGNVSAAEMMGRVPTELPEDDRIAAHRASAEQANAAFGEPGWHERSVELPFGALPAPVFASIRSGDLYVHAWDLAVAIGADTDLDRELGEAIFAATAPVLSPSLRGEGRPFGEEQFCAPERPIADRLAGFLGRTV